MSQPGSRWRSSDGRPPWAVVTAGIVFGYATAVRPTNIVFAAAAAILFASERDWRSATRFVVGGLAVLPIVLAFLPKKRGYDLELARDQTGLPLWSNDYLVSTFTDSSVYRPLLLVVLLPVVAVGVLALPSRRIALMLLGGALANALIYSFFRATFEHPRYLQAGLPAAPRALGGRRGPARRACSTNGPTGPRKKFVSRGWVARYVEYPGPVPTSVVTGGAGFLGSHLCDALLERGHRVVCVDNLETGSLANIEHMRQDEFVFVPHDLTAADPDRGAGRLRLPPREPGEPDRLPAAAVADA